VAQSSSGLCGLAAPTESACGTWRALGTCAAAGATAVLDGQRRGGTGRGESGLRWWQLGIDVQRGGGGSARLGGMDNGDSDVGVVLGSAGSAMLRLGKSNEETVRMTGRSQHQGRRMGQRCSPGRDEQWHSACSAMMLSAASASGYGSVPHTGRRSQPAWKWCGKVVEHR
jgi:hypothetical protein